MNKNAIKVIKSLTDDPNKFAERKYGWELFPFVASSGQTVVFKWITLPRDSEPVQELIKYYENGHNRIPAQIKQFLYDLDVHFIEVIDENGKKTTKLNLTDKCWETLCNWRMEIIFEEEPKIIRLMPTDHTFPNPLIPYKWIYKYVKDFLKLEMEDGIVGFGYIND